MATRRRADGGVLLLGRSLREDYDLQETLLRALAIALLLVAIHADANAEAILFSDLGPGGSYLPESPGYDRVSGAFATNSDGRSLALADRFTVADISIAYALLLAGKLGLDEQFPPLVTTYWRHLRDRDGYRRADAAQIKATAEQNIDLTNFEPS